MTARKVVMISSTARDLPVHREQVRLACERAGFEPREMMEHLPALDSNAVDISLRMVDAAEVYIGILAFRYGSVPEGAEISITEMEYNRAVEQGKPRMIFLMHDDHPIRPRDMETGPGAVKLAALKARIGQERVAAFFKSPEDLRSHVVEALTALRPQLGLLTALPRPAVPPPACIVTPPSSPRPCRMWRIRTPCCRCVT